MANSARTQPGAERTTTSYDESNPLDGVTVFYEKNKKPISTITTIILVVVLGYLGYTKLYKGPAEEKAATALSFPQMAFESDSLNIALNGDGKNPGFVKIAKKYDGIASGNLALYYEGLCYLKMGNFKDAITALKGFNGKGTIIENVASGALGEAYMESGDTPNAIASFKKASSDKNDAVATPMYLYQLGLAYEIANNNPEAITAFKRIRDEYPRSMQARDMDKELARLGDVN